MATVLLAGTVTTGAGVAVVGATVEVFDRNTTTPVRSTFTGGTDASGNWNFGYDPGANARRVDVRITNGTSISFLKHDDQIQVSSVETANLRIINPAFTFEYNIVPAAITAARQLNLPLITATDTLAVLALAQTFLTGVKTFNSSILAIRNPADTFSYTVVASAIAAARNLTIPLLTADDTLAVLGLAQTFSAVLTLSATAAFTAASPFSVANGQTLTVSTTAQTIGAATLTVPNFAGVGDTFAFTTLAQTLSNKTLSAPTFSGAYSFGGTPTFGATMAGASTFSGAITLSSTLTFGTANGRIIGGTTDFAINNSANNANNLAITDAGAVTIRSTLTISGAGTALSVTNNAQISGARLDINGVNYSWPSAQGTSGQQLQTDGANPGVLSWAAAGSWRKWKNLLRTWDNPQDALARMVATPVYDFRYKPEGLVTTGDFESLYTGVLAEDAPWAMHHNNKIINPVNALGYMVLGFQAVDKRVSQLEEENQALRMEVAGLQGR